MTPTQTRPATLPQLLAILFALVPVIAVVTLVLVPGGGHPSLGGVLLMGAVVPTLAAYLSRALEGSDFPSALFLVLGALEYPLVGYGVGSLAARVRSSSSSRLGILLLVAYIAAHFGAHIVLNQQAVNLRLLADPNPGVSRAAVARLAASGDGGAVPALQDRFMQSFERYGNADEALIVTLTQLGGARGWQDLLESGRLGGQRRVTHVDRRDERPARAVREVFRFRAEWTPRSNQPRSNQRGTRESSRGDQTGSSPDTTDVFLGSLAQEDIIRLEQEPAVVADEWASWAASEAAPCRVP